MLIYIDPGLPRFSENETNQEFPKTLIRYAIPDWKPISFNENRTALSVQLKLKKRELISRFLDKDNVTVALGPNLTAIIKTEQGEMLKNHTEFATGKMDRPSSEDAKTGERIKEIAVSTQKVSFFAIVAGFMT